MYKKLINNKFPFKLCAAAFCSAIVYKKFTEENFKPHYAAGFNYSRRYYPASSEYPDLSRNRNIMARNLTKDLYAKLRDKRTPNGFTIDDAIQTGVDNIGRFSFTGAVAGDEETYHVFRELFDKIILEKHNFKQDQQHITDLDASKLKDGVFDSNYVLNVRIRTIRNIKGYCLPSFCTRGERRDIEDILVKALYNVDSNFKGTYYSLKELSPEEETSLANNNVWMERPFLPTDLSSNIGRDWPDARGIWLNEDKTLAAFLNRKDHVLLSVIEKTNDLQASFTKFADFVKNFEQQVRSQKWDVMHNRHLGYITTDPKNLGTALKLSVRIRLPRLSQDSRLSTLLKLFNLSQSYRIVSETQKTSVLDEEKNRESSILEITSCLSLGKSEVEITQMFINSINKLIETEKLLESGGQLDEVLYQK